MVQASLRSPLPRPGHGRGASLLQALRASPRSAVAGLPPFGRASSTPVARLASGYRVRRTALRSGRKSGFAMLFASPSLRLRGPCLPRLAILTRHRECLVSLDEPCGLPALEGRIRRPAGSSETTLSQLALLHNLLPRPRSRGLERVKDCDDRCLEAPSSLLDQPSLARSHPRDGHDRQAGRGLGDHLAASGRGPRGPSLTRSESRLSLRSSVESNVDAAVL